MSTRKSRSKPRSPSPKKAGPKLVRENEELRRDLEARNRDLDESLERETATSDILRMIASSPTELQSVLDAIAERAARLCDAADAVMWRVDGEVRRRVAHFGPIPISVAQDEGPVMIVALPLVARLSIARRSMFMIFKQPKLTFLSLGG
jgi:hypothetical protein